MLAVCIAAGLATPATAGASSGPIGATQPALAAKKPAKKKKKTSKKCKRGQVPVQILTRRTCQSLKRALPRPRAADSRLVFIRSGLGGSLGPIKDRRGRRAPSIAKALRRISPRAERGLQRAVPKALQMLDALSTKATGARARAAADGASDSYSFDLGNGASVDIRVKLAQQASMEIALTGRRDGRSVRTRFLINEDQGFRGSACPTAEGTLDATDGVKVAITTELLDDHGGVDYYYTYVIVQKTKLHGEVGDDAKLDTLKVTDKLEQSEISGGSIFGGGQINSEIKRETVVNMDTGDYDPGRSRVTVSVALSGILRIFQSSALAGATERLQKAADEGFAATVKRAIEKYKERETGWNTPNTCAQLRLDPPSGSRTLGIGDSGSLRGDLSAQDGGKPASATWEAKQQANASFNLTSARANPSSFTYAVTNGGSGIQVKTTVRAVSRAGVAEAPWVQDTRDFKITTIAGNFSGEMIFPVAGRQGKFSWTGGATFTRLGLDTAGAFGSYVLSTGTVTVTASGAYRYGEGGCSMSGTALIPLPAESGAISVSPPEGPSIFAPGPRAYSGSVSPPPPPASNITVTLSGCDEDHLDLNGQTRPLIVDNFLLFTGQAPQQSPDGITYNGTASADAGFGATSEWGWTLTGTS
jgi:hypothetical protein